MAQRVKLLAFDTSSNACSVALLDTDRALPERVSALHQSQSQRQGQLILPMIDNLLAKTGLALKDLDAIACGIGPGSYTGTRMAVSVAQALAKAAACPLITVSSLAIIAQNAYMQRGWTSLLVAVDARANEIYWAHFRVDDEGLVALLGAETVSKVDKIDLAASQQEAYGVGDAWAVYADALRDRFNGRIMTTDSDQVPNAEALLVLAAKQYEQKRWGRLVDAIPVYLR